MTIGASIFCLAAGAILTFAVETDSTEGININTIGIILMVVGAIGMALYALVWGPRTRRVAPTTTIVEDRPVQPAVEMRERVVTQRPVAERHVYE